MEDRVLDWKYGTTVSQTLIRVIKPRAPEVAELMQYALIRPLIAIFR
jgi:hypothetical protein